MGYRVNFGTTRPQPLTFTFDGVSVEAYSGETIAAALIAAGIRGFRRDMHKRLRGPYCNMGTCFECVLEVRESMPARTAPKDAGAGSWRTVRACLTQVCAALQVRRLQAPELQERGRI